MAWQIIAPNERATYRWRGASGDTSRDDLRECPECGDEYHPADGHECRDARCARCNELRTDDADGVVVPEMLGEEFDALNMHLPHKSERVNVPLCGDCNESRWMSWEQDELVRVVAELAGILGVDKNLHPRLVAEKAKAVAANAAGRQ